MRLSDPWKSLFQQEYSRSRSLVLVRFPEEYTRTRTVHSPTSPFKHTDPSPRRCSCSLPSLPSPMPFPPPPTLLCVLKAAHDAEVLCLAFSPILVPVPPTSPVSPAPATSRTSSPTHASTDADANPNLSGGGAASGGGGAPSSGAQSQKWEAIDPLGSTVASDGSARAGESDDGREKGDTALVLLASASRDRLVHVFDASASRGWMDPADGDGERRGDAGKGDCGGEGGYKSCYPLLKTLDNHSSSVTAVKFSKDGKRCGIFSRPLKKSNSRQ